MDLGLSGRTAIVCGATSGMGLAIAAELVREGANVAMFGRRRDLLEREADRLGALAVQGDLTIPQHLERLVHATVGAFGGVDVLVLNGGGPPAGPAVGLTAEAVEVLGDREVALDGQSAEPVGLALEQVAAATEHGDVRALADELLGNREAHARRGAADDRRPAAEPQVHPRKANRAVVQRP